MLIEFIWFWMIKEYIMIAKIDLDQNDKRIIREKVVQQLKDRLASCLSLIYTQ
jgi:DNA-binding winged helix-turn-helix (wHTH) protein